MESPPEFDALAFLPQNSRFSVRASRYFVMTLSTDLLTFVLHSALWALRGQGQRCGGQYVHPSLYTVPAQCTHSTDIGRIHSFIHISFNLSNIY